MWKRPTGTHRLRPAILTPAATMRHLLRLRHRRRAILMATRRIIHLPGINRPIPTGLRLLRATATLRHRRRITAPRTIRHRNLMSRPAATRHRLADRPMAIPMVLRLTTAAQLSAS